MELWVRSQDRMLLSRTVDIRIVIEQEGTSIIDDTTSYILGMYESEERALEVLDEIQKYINNECEFLEREQHTSMGIYINKEQMRVYEMPKE